MGESPKEVLRVHFDARVRLEFHGATRTSDGGLLACRELDDALGLTEAATRYLQESRNGRCSGQKDKCVPKPVEDHDLGRKEAIIDSQ
jgi:hypothetical protein